MRWENRITFYEERPSWHRVSILSIEKLSCRVDKAPFGMHVITRKRLNDFARNHPDTRTALEHWYRNMKRRNFASLAELRTMFPTADKVGKLTVFNMGGNKVRF